jgi:hypothetical protein
VTDQDLLEAQVFLAAQKWLDEMTEAMYEYYAIRHQPSTYTPKKRSWAKSSGTKGNRLPRIEYALPDVLRMFRGDFREYKRTEYIWGRFLNTAMAYRGLYALAVHEFAHVLDRHVNGPALRDRAGKRIIHGRRFCQAITQIRRDFEPPDLRAADVKTVARLRGMS